MKHLSVLVLVVVFPAGAWAEAKGGHAALVQRARTMLRQGPRLSPALSRTANSLLRRAATGAPTLYAPVAERGKIMVFDRQQIRGGFASSSVTVRPMRPKTHTWDLHLIREDSSRFSLQDVALAAKKLPSGNTLEVRFTARANGKTSGTYSLVNPSGRTLGQPGDLKALHRLVNRSHGANGQVQARLGVSAGYMKKLLANFALLDY